MTARYGRHLGILAFASMLGCTPPPPSSSIAVANQPGLRFLVDRRPDVAPPPPAAGEGPATPATDGQPPSGPAPGAGAEPGPADTPPLPDAPSRGGGGSKSPPAAPAGVVLGLGDAGPAPAPVEGAQVWTTDGRTAVTGADGRFALAGAWPADGTWMVRHPRYRTSTVVGVGPQAGLALHLKTDRAGTAVLAPDGSTQYDVTGRLVDADGDPAAGMAVGLQAPDGSFGPLVTSEADGTFTMRVFAHGPTIADATFVALDRTGQAAMAVSRALTLSQAAPAIDFDPTTAGVVDPLRVVPTTHELEVLVDDRGLGGVQSVYVEVTLATGETIVVFADGPLFKLGAIPGARYGVQAELAVGDGVHSVFRKDGIGFAGSGRTQLTATMLRPPVITAPSGGVGPLGPLVAWAPDPEVKGTEVQLNDPFGLGFQWEGYTTGSSLPFAPGADVVVPPGDYKLRVVAWDAPGMAPRQVASLERSAYRVLPLGPTYRYAVTERQLAL